jgi:hypothetical protein
MTPLYRPGDGTAEATVRSSEMLYRSWPTMQAYASDRGKPGEIARSASGGYESEFQEFVFAGQRGDQAAGIAAACATGKASVLLVSHYRLVKEGCAAHSICRVQVSIA